MVLDYCKIIEGCKTCLGIESCFEAGWFLCLLSDSSLTRNIFCIVPMSELTKAMCWNSKLVTIKKETSMRLVLP